ncbi:hypothetical protein PAESOLCIP111_03784 [Paenibacillus solanacearum]|uniref:Uncharacterized protein n=1 Tax=Paenibacillus solanacearum TaxID=2048548 RepID=A0A916NR56_9BACL|nr:hypothetical protein [Paenibacillus solanacearum]CAG7636787.1 hypothetical protein PAESOLCIP111_03784 [Paenibacillus solanacearum]
MSWIISQPYYKIERELHSGGQSAVVHARVMYLYPDQVVTFARTFRLEDVFDMSYRHVGASEGFLYLHTNQGVFPYMVKEDPACFIQSYREARKKG